MKKYNFLTGTGSDNQVLVTEKDTYILYEFSNENDYRWFLAQQQNAVDKGTQVARKSVQNDDLSWTSVVTKAYKVLVRK
jgi:hypothetical protein